MENNIIIENKKIQDHKELYLLAYGTLRKDQYNYNRIRDLFQIKDLAISYVETTKLRGYSMYNVGAYPMAVFTNKPSETIVFDILRISDKAFMIIDNMEINAGYTRHKLPINIETQSFTLKTECIIYLANVEDQKEIDEIEVLNKTDKVESGDWVQYYKNFLLN